ncbi:MAG TPA: TraR/DksA family transcriptional regulator [Pyrinomonadaceae bacterium]|nr:TraR/DksA family transcriptional regulator [Pyrinomonadaceae bacterium]
MKRRSQRHLGNNVNGEKLEHFRRILEQQLQQHVANVSTEQANALSSDDDGVKDSVDMSLLDVSKEIAFRLSERESQIVADIDQALLRIREGSYGICASCGQPINERRLEAVPTARYDAQCQTLIESANGEDDLPSL